MNNCLFNLKSFLESETNSNAYIDGNRTILLTKVPAPGYPRELSLLYMVDLWEHGSLWEKAELAGMYQPEAHVLWNPNWEIRKLYDTTPEYMREGLTLRTLGSRLKDISQLATTMLRQEAERGLFPVTEDAERGYKSAQEYINYGLSQDAERHFMERKPVTFGYNVNLSAGDLNWHETLEALLAPDALAKRYMEKYARKMAKALNCTIETLPLLIAAVNELEADFSHPYHLRRKIAESVDPDTMQTVRIIVQRDNVRLESKIETRCIRALLCCSYVSDYQLEKKPRSTWKVAFGYDSIRPEDIVSITYGKKTLYTKEDK